MKVSDFHIRNYDKLDHFLYKLCKELIFAHKIDPEKYGWVAAGVLDPRNRFIWAINVPSEDGDRVHAEHAAIVKYNDTYGDIPKGSIILTTLSPCSEYMNDREGPSCTELINNSVVHKVYCGFMDPTQGDSDAFQHKKFTLVNTQNSKIQEMCKSFAEKFLGDLNENREPAEKPVTIHTNPYYRGATIGAGVKEQLPVTKMPIEELQMWESDKTLRTKKVRDWVKNTLIPKLQDKGRLTPLIVWNRKGKHFVIDGNHRFLAYKAAGFKGDVPVKIVPQEMVAINNKVLEPVDESKETRQALSDQHFEFPQQGQYGYRQGYKGRGVLELADGRTGKIINLGEFGDFDDDYKPNQKWLRIVFTNPNMDDDAWAELEDMLWSDQVDENFADGKGPGRPGDSQRHGIPKHATKAELEKASHSKGRKGQLARWQLNMRRGKEN